MWQNPKRRYEMKKIMAVVGILCLVAALSAQPEVEWGGLFYSYTFFWQNADFNDNIADADNYTYLHGDVHALADFGEGVSAFVKIGAWGMYGMHPVWGYDLNGNADPRVGLLEAYLKVDNLFDLPVSLKVGKQNVLYGDGAVMFDGGEDGFLGAKVNVSYDPVSLDLFYYRLAEYGGIALVGTGADSIPGDLNLFGTYMNIGLMEGKINLQGYYFLRVQDQTGLKDRPMWVGGRTEGAPIEGLNFKAEFTLMTGKKDFDQGTDIDYGGMHAMAALDYAPQSLPVSFGGAFVMFSGDDPSTSDKDELYVGATDPPYTFGFYKSWPGFGPAHTMHTSYGFACVTGGDLFELDSLPVMTNLNVINAHLGFTQGPLSLRGDFFMYTRNEVPEGVEDNLGNEIALLATYNYRDALTIGAAVGYWMPGDVQKQAVGEDNASGMIGGSIFFAKGF